MRRRRLTGRVVINWSNVKAEPDDESLLSLQDNGQPKERREEREALTCAARMDVVRRAAQERCLTDQSQLPKPSPIRPPLEPQHQNENDSVT